MGEIKSVKVRRIISTLLVIVAFVGILCAQGVVTRHTLPQPASLVDTLKQARRAGSADADAAPRKRKVDYMADLVKPYNNTTDSVIYLVGDFAAHHNGAVIWCDSAVRYSDTKWGFFSRVVINQDSIFIYGDSAIYDGEGAHAEIYAPIVKVVDGDALLYTYNFSFNTETRVGRYTDGGVLVHDDNILESVRGYYDAQEHNVICVESVEVHGADYDLKTDSIIYNTQSEFARFFTNSEIWNVDGEYLSADEGYYDRAQDLYMVTRNGYLLTSEQELWGDTLEYHRSAERIVARNNIQMDDMKNKMMAFGDFAEYWQAEGNALLTRRAAAISYDTSESDSLFLSADTVWMLTIEPTPKKIIPPMPVDSSSVAQGNNGMLGFTPPPASMMQSGAGNILSSTPPPASMAQGGAGNILSATPPPPASTISSANMAEGKEPQGATPAVDIKAPEEAAPIVEPSADSLRLIDSIAQLSPKQQKAYYAALAKAEAERLKVERKREKARARKILLDSIAMVRQAKINKQLDAAKQKELERIVQDSVRRAERRAKLVAKGRDVSALDREDSLAMLRNARIRGEIARDTIKHDSIQDQPQVEQETDEETTPEVEAPDSAYRLLKAYRNVKMYRSDAQMVCDSLVSNSRDSIIHLFVAPVMWNQANQLAAEQVDVYSSNGKLQRAEFMGSPIMIAEIDTTYYNQVAGKSMIALFENNEIYRNDVDGNVQTIYFRTESEDSPLVVEMTYLESASASFFIENQQLVGITYRNEVPFSLYPLALIPASQPLRLQNFKWVPELRPTRNTIFDRRVRPTEREERESRRRPTFSIVSMMDRYKERLLLSGEWTDREDQLTPELIEWRERHREK